MTDLCMKCLAHGDRLTLENWKNSCIHLYCYGAYTVELYRLPVQCRAHSELVFKGEHEHDEED